MSAGSELVGLVDPLAAAVQSCPAVAGLHGGQFGQATTYLPGRRVAGIGIDAGAGAGTGEIVVGVVGRYPATVAEIAAQVRAAVATVAPGVPVTVRVEDLALPAKDPPTPATPPAPATSPPAPATSPTPVTPPAPVTPLE